MRQTVFFAGVTLVCAMTSPVAFSGSDYPNQAIRMIVPAAPGGAADTIARMLANKLEPLGKPVIVDNRAGAASIIGTTAAAKSAPDGYTLMLGFAGGLAVNPSLYPDLPYKPKTDFAPISLVAKSPLVVVVNPSLPITSIDELVRYAKAHPGDLNYASTGSGSTQHLCMELIRSTTGIELVHVPYKGSSPAYVDLLAGRTPLMCDNVVSLKNYINDGKLVALAVTSAQRAETLKAVPTLAEAGLKDVEATGWYGLLAPASTPPDIIATLNSAVRNVLGQAGTQQFLNEQGLIPAGNSPEEFAAFIDSETLKWAKVVKDSGATVQ